MEQTSNLLSVFRALLLDLDVGFRDRRYILRRLQNEGVKFCTQLLPSFSKHMLTCLEDGYWSPFGSSIRVVRGLPELFQGFLRQIFSYNENLRLYVVKADADPISIWIIRQVCDYAYKLALPFDDEVLDQFGQDFFAKDREVLSASEYDHNFVDAMRSNFETYYPESSRLTMEEIAMDAHPGPGTFAGCDSTTYWRENYLPVRVPPQAESWSFGLRFNRRHPRPSTSLSAGESEVLFVPKDSRGPRTIVREPYEMLMFQMGFNTQMVRRLAHDTRGSVDLRDQSKNYCLARSSSITRSHATIDLKDASDRISYAIVRHIFRHTPLDVYFRNFVTRNVVNRRTGKRALLRKLSGMGSGSTFPTMSLIIHLAICTDVSTSLNINYRECMKHVYVYGDDIVVPTSWYRIAVRSLHKVGLQVNTQKSYRYGFFRESCGGDFYRGNDVTPVRLKLQSANIEVKDLRVYPEDFNLYVLAIERHCRELVERQLFNLAEYYYAHLESYLGPLPKVARTSHILGRLAPRDEVFETIKYDERGNARRIRCWAPVAKVEQMPDMCPTRFLLASLHKDAESGWQGNLFPAGRRLSFGQVTVPRRVRLALKRRNSLALT